jgi:hypothetical protein
MKAYLKVKISPGMFPHESAVVIETDYPEGRILTSGFFEKEHIHNGKLEVEVLEEINERVFVKLPGRTLEAPGDKGYVTVRKEDLEYGTGS